MTTDRVMLAAQRRAGRTRVVNTQFPSLRRFPPAAWPRDHAKRVAAVARNAGKARSGRERSEDRAKTQGLTATYPAKHVQRSGDGCAKMRR